MSENTPQIYYADKTVLDIISTDFDLIEEKGWYQLYRNKEDKSYWRLDQWDKYQKQFFVHLESPDNWESFDAKTLIIELLRQTRGTSEKICAWQGCDKFSHKELAFCEVHAYEEMGIRR